MRLRRGFALAAAAMLAVVSLPGSTTGLGEAVAKVATPGSSDYRHFSSLDKAARRFGASDAQINTVAKSVKTLGLQFAADPTRLFGRVSGSTQQWQTALGTPLSKQAATASSPFITYTLPAQTPAALQPSGTSLLLPQTLVYDPTAEGNRPPNGMRPTPSPGAASTATPTKAARPFPANTGTPLVAGCSAALLAQRRVYTQQQVQTAYGIDTLRAHAAGTPVITVLDLGGGWLANDLKLAGQCFGYFPPKVTQTQGDGVAAPIGHADDETSLDLQTVAAVAPTAQVRLVQSTLNGVLDGFSRAVGDSGGVPDVVSVSFGGCALAENRGLPAYTAVINAVLAMTALAGVSSFVAAGDAGSTTCGTSVPGTTLSYPAGWPFCSLGRPTRTARTRRITAPSPMSARWPTSCPAGPTSSTPPCRPSAGPAARRRLSPRPPRWWSPRSGRRVVPGSGWPTAGSTRPRHSRRPSSTSPRAATTSPASAAARPPSATTRSAGWACRTGPPCRPHCPSRADRSTASCRRSASRHSSLLLERARHHGEVLVAEPGIHGLLPFASQAGKGGEPVVAGRLHGQAHVLERERQRELGRELALGDPLQLGCLPRGHQRAAAEGVDHRLGVKPQPTSKRHRGGNRFRRERDPGVVHQLQSRSSPDRADPDGALAERVEQGSHARAGLLGP